jgi:diamine N-acetyltransferase
VLIREASVEECEAICALFEQVDAFHAAARPEMFRPPQRPVRTPEFIQKLLTSTTDTLFVAPRDGRLVGLAWVITRNAPDLPIFVPRRFAVIETLVVDEEARRQGVGRVLVERIQHWATDYGLQEVQLSVHEFNAGARAFYTELGYETVERRLRRRL